SVMPETYNSSKSAEINSTLNLKLRKDAVELRELVAAGTSDDAIQERKEKMLNEVYRMLAYAFGEPVSHFDWEYRDDKKQYHIDQNLTPQSFFEKYVGWNLDDYVSIINAPTDDKPYNHTYTIEMLGNVLGGREVEHLNVSMADFKQLAIKQLQAGQSVWFGCDVGKSSDRQKGVMATDVYNKDELFDVDLAMSKAERLDYGESLMTHAMVITGVDLVDGQPTKWKVENSWGDKVGSKGFFVMSDAWMDEYCYQVVVNKEFLPDNLKQAQAEEPTVLAPWDPMGALA
ncbi:aminopeptidase C, partial [Lactiplantibacillus pentosus]